MWDTWRGLWNVGATWVSTGLRGALQDGTRLVRRHVAPRHVDRRQESHRVRLLGTPADPHGEEAYELEVQTSLDSRPWMPSSHNQGNAEFFRIDDDFGTLEVGKVADLLIFDGNPLDDIRILQNVIGSSGS